MRSGSANDLTSSSPCNPKPEPSRMDLYSLLGVARRVGRRDRARVSAARAAVSPGHQSRAIAWPRRCSGRSSDAYDVLGDRGAAARVRPRRAGERAGGRRRGDGVVRGLRFLGAGRGRRSRRRSRSCSPTCFRTPRARRRRRRAARDDRSRRLRLSFEDAMRGGTFPLSVTRQERCATCGGDGRVPRPPVVVSRRAAAQGTRRWARGHMVFTEAVRGAATGSGRLTSQPCRGVRAASGVAAAQRGRDGHRAAGDRARRARRRAGPRPCRRARRAGRRSLRDDRRRAASVLPARRAAICT